MRLLVSEIGLFFFKCPPFCLNVLQNGGYNGMMYSAIQIYAPENLYIELTMMDLRPLVSEI